MLELERQEMLDAVMNRDSSYDGKFYTGVISTGIYCIPSCKARKPKPENILFFATREEAIAYGLRGCKRCKSESYPDILPDWMHTVLQHFRENVSERIDETRIAEISSVDISTVRRHFEKHAGMSPIALHRIIRLNHAMNLLRQGHTYLQAAYDSGYESASAFREAFQNQFGCTPGSVQKGER